MTHVKKLRGLILTVVGANIYSRNLCFSRFCGVEAFNEYNCDLDEKIMKICFDF